MFEGEDEGGRCADEFPKNRNFEMIFLVLSFVLGAAGRRLMDCFIVYFSIPFV